MTQNQQNTKCSKAMLNLQNVTKHVGANQTFHIIQDKDIKMSAIQEEIYVLVVLNQVINGV